MAAIRRIALAFGSYGATIILLSLYAVVLAAATFFEARHGAPEARRWFYVNPAFIILQLLLVVNFIAGALRYKLAARKKWDVLVLHGAFVVILAGALVTHCFGREGTLHLREGQTLREITVADPYIPGRTERLALPFEVELRDFRLERYPGSGSPLSYQSTLTITGPEGAHEVIVGINRVAREGGYRIFQTSYDTDERGSILSLNYDPWGMPVSYAGYVMLGIGILMMVFGPRSRFRTLLRKLGKLAPCVVLLVFAASVAAQPVPPEGIADQFGRLLVQERSGRITPVDTYSREVLRKIYGRDTYGGYTSNQVLLGMLAWPVEWASAPMIHTGSGEIAGILDTRSKHINLISLFDAAGNYKIGKAVETAYGKPSKQQDKADKDLLKFDDRVNLFCELLEGRALALYPLPEDPAGRWLSAGDELSAFRGMDSMFVSRVPKGLLAALDDGNGTDKLFDLIARYQRNRAGIDLPDENRVSAEVLYNRLDIFGRLFKYYLAAGVLLLAAGCRPLPRRTRGVRIAIIAAVVLAVACFVLHSLGFALRWYVSGQVPWSNAYETMVYVAWAVVLAGLLFARRSTLALAMGCLMAGVVLFVARLGWMDPQITPLVPVLRSPWLMIHVSVVMLGYGFLGMSFLTGLFNLCTAAFRNRGMLRELTLVGELAMIAGVFLLAAGIFTGAVWANESWGRYWGWDPKETWALITLVAYAVVLHLRLVPSLNNPLAFTAGSVYAFFTVLMTYFGVNFLGGLHAYGQTGSHLVIWIIGIVLILITVLTLLVLKKHRNSIKL